VKLNEFKEIQEIDMSSMFGNYGAAALQQAGNRLSGSGEGQLSTQDRMAKNMFISDFVGRATTNLASAIQSGLVDPNAIENTQSTPTATTAGTNVPGETPEQKRIRLQKAAQQNIDKTAMPFSKVQPAAAPTPDSIRQQKQAAAASNAQQQMTPFNKLPSNQQAIAANNVRKKQQATAGSNAQQQMAPFSKVSPAPAVWKNNRNPSLPAQRRPTMKENEFFKLNTVFESIVNIDEAEVASAQTISQYVKNMVTKYLKGVNISSPEVQRQINTLANQVQSTYKQDKGKAALTKLANLGYSISYADNGTAPNNTAVNQPASAMDAIKAGISQGLGKEGTKTAKNDTFTQTKDLIGKLDNAGKQKVLSAIEQEVGTEPSAMDNMARQLAARGQSQTSTGGATIATGKGIRHAASPTNPNQATNISDKISQANQSFKQRKVNSKALKRAKARKAAA
jgi:hypothetical protein